MKRYNHYHPRECRLWFRYSLGLEITLCDEPSIGSAPAWLRSELDDVGTTWQELASLPSNYWWTEGGPEVVGWLLGNGIAPGQRFRMAVYPPEHTESWTDCGTEYDTTYSAELLTVEHMPSAHAVRQWERFLWECAEERAERARHEEAVREAHRQRETRAHADPSALFLLSEPFHAPGDSYDWMPSGLLVRLFSSHMPNHALCEGRSSKGNREEAVVNLLGAAAKALPHIRSEFIRALPYNRPHIDRSRKVAE